MLVGIVSRPRFAADALAPVNQLPPEILCEVFFHLRPVIRRGSELSRGTKEPFKDLLAVTHTCQYWRVTAIAAADLWSQLVARDRRKKFDNITRLFISRSGELPMGADLGRRLEVVAPHADRLRTLFCRGCTVDDFSHLSNRPVPLLETFHILPSSSSNHHGPGCSPLPTLFNRDSPSLRELVVDGYDPFPNNRFKNLSSFSLWLPDGEAGLTFWTLLFMMLQDSPQLEELFLLFGFIYDHPPFPKDSPTPASLHALQKLHLHGVPSSLTRRFLNSLDLIPNGIAMQFVNIDPEFDWIFPPTLPPELSLRAVTSLEIVYLSAGGFTIQGTNAGMGIRVVEFFDSKTTHAGVFSRLAEQRNPPLPLRELWIHIGRKERCKIKLLPLSKFPNLEKLVVRATTNGNHIYRLLQKLNVHHRHVPCPLLSTLDLSGLVNMEHLLKVLRARSKAGCRLGKLRLGKTHLLVEDALKLGVRDCVDELEFSGEDAEPHGMELPAVCTTELGGWWEPWTRYQVGFL